MSVPFVALHRDAFNPVMITPPIVRNIDTNAERALLIREVIRLASSDSRFAQKAFDAIVYILTANQVVIPTVSSLVPSNAQIGGPSFTLHVHGTNFTTGSKIVFNGGVENTVFVSATELTTGVDMSTALVATTVPVAVQSAEGVLSNTQSFTFNPAAIGTFAVGRGIVTESVKPIPSAKKFEDTHEVVISQERVISKEPKLKTEKEEK